MKHPLNPGIACLLHLSQAVFLVQQEIKGHHCSHSQRPLGAGGWVGDGGDTGQQLWYL